ncbi:MAG: FHA domain-containing protein [Planctomycetes bacterium]|nr:FHA domain-containing protein [Planctomycetota bacterium]
MAELEIEIREPGKPPRRLRLRPGLGIGRHPDNDCLIEDPKVSGFHARIERRGVDWVLVDLGSSNGTHVLDGASLGREQSQVLVTGLRFMTGYTEFEVVTAKAAPASEATRMMPQTDQGEGLVGRKPEARPPEPTPTKPSPAPRRERPVDVESKGVPRAPISELSPIIENDSVSESFPSVDVVPPKAARPKVAPGAVPPKEPDDHSEARTIGFARVDLDAAPRGKVTSGPDPDEETILSPADRNETRPTPARKRPAPPAYDAPTIATPLPGKLGRALPPQDDESTLVTDPAPHGDLPRADQGLSFMRPRLFIAGDGQRSVVVIDKREFGIGRRLGDGSHESDCPIESFAVSARHAAIHYRQGRFYVEDRNSRNGTTVGDKKLEAGATRELKPDDRLVFGMVEVLFVVDRDEQLHEIPRRPYRDALDRLVRKGLVAADRAEALWQRCAVEGEHPAESLIMSGAITVKQWSEALGASRGGGSRRTLKIVLVVVVLALLAAIAWVVLEKRGEFGF